MARIMVNVCGYLWEVEGIYTPGQTGDHDQEGFPASFEVETVFLNGVELPEPARGITTDYIQRHHEGDCVDAYLNSGARDAAEAEYEHAVTMAEAGFYR